MFEEFRLEQGDLRCDPALHKAIARAKRWFEDVASGRQIPSFEVDHIAPAPVLEGVS
jgi:hypothetical protein